MGWCQSYTSEAKAVSSLLNWTHFIFSVVFLAGIFPTSIVINNFDFRVTSTAIETRTDIR